MRLLTFYLFLLLLINNQFQLCKSQVDSKYQPIFFFEKTLDKFTKFYLYDQDIENNGDFDALLRKTGLYEKNILKQLKNESLTGESGEEMNFIENFNEELNDFHNYYKLIFDCMKNKSYTYYSAKKICTQGLVNDRSIYRINLSAVVKKYILPDDNGNKMRIFNALSKIWLFKKEAENFGCSLSSESIQMKIRNLLGVIIFVMIRQYALLSYTYCFYYPGFLREQNSSGNIKKTENLCDEQEILWKLRNDIHLITKEGLKAIKYAPADLRRCDPPRHIKHVTYERLTNFIQGWVGSEEYLNKENKCGLNCAFNQTEFYYISPKNYDKEDATIGHYDERLISDGILHDCEVAPFFNFIYKQIKPLDPERIFHHLATKQGVFKMKWGKSFQPSNHYKVEQLTRKDIRHLSSTSSQGISKTCKICLCKLERVTSSESIKAFSSIPVIVPSDRVVTGIRWIIRNNTVFLELLGTKFINHFSDFTSTSKWYTQRSTKKDETIVLDYEGRSLGLDDITLPENMFVIGAKFIVIDGFICISVHGVSISQNGNINHGISGWYHISIDAEYQKTELILDEPDCSELAPTGVNSANKELSVPGKNFIRFQPTDFKKDAAQTTVPYFDIQEVVTDPPTPLKGLGIYYKGIKGYGGFVGLKLITANIAKRYINNETLNRDFQAISSFVEYSLRS